MDENKTNKKKKFQAYNSLLWMIIIMIVTRKIHYQMTERTKPQHTHTHTHTEFFECGFRMFEKLIKKKN